MRYKRVEKIDYDFSVMGYGCWGASGQGSWEGHNDEDQIKAIQKAIELGINFFDVAPVYGLGHAEEILGKAIKGHRDKIFIATKVGLPWNKKMEVRNDVTAKSIQEEFEASLKRLDVDYIDLYQIHWPTDSGVAIEETANAMKKIKDSGRVKYIGLTNFSVADYRKFNDIVEVVSMQGLYNMLEQNPESYHGIPLNYRIGKEILPLCSAEGVAFFPYSPLFQGLLTGKVTTETIFTKDDVRINNPELNGDKRDINLKVLDKITNIEALKGRKPSEIAINYLVAKAEVTSIIASHANPAEVEENINALEWEMDQQTVAEIDNIVEESL